MDCNDESVKDFVGYKNPTYAYYINGNTIEKNDISSNFQFVAWAMPAKIWKVVWNLYAGFQTNSVLQKQPVGRAHATVNSTYRRLQNSSAENAKRSQLIIATTSGVGRILESDILGIAAMNCNDGSVKGFVGYKYPTTLATACLKRIFSLAFHATNDPVFKTPPLGFFGIGGGIGGIVDKNIEVGFGTG